MTAHSLQMRNFRSDLLPLTFETVVTLESGRMQYNLRTTVRPDQDGRTVEKLSSAEWEVVPSNVTTFELYSHLRTVCEVFVPFEMTNTLNAFNELAMFK